MQTFTCRIRYFLASCILYPSHSPLPIYFNLFSHTHHFYSLPLLSPAHCPLLHLCTLHSSLTFSPFYSYYIVVNNLQFNEVHIILTYLQGGLTALYYASIRGHLEIVQLLLHDHHDINICNTVCTVNTAVYVACMNILSVCVPSLVVWCSPPTCMVRVMDACIRTSHTCRHTMSHSKAKGWHIYILYMLRIEHAYQGFISAFLIKPARRHALAGL